jgi:large subunit ribosomal protein L3
MLNTVLGTKGKTSQLFDSEGQRLPVTEVVFAGCRVTGIRNFIDHGYWAIQLGYGQRKVKTEKGAKDKLAPLHFAEIRVDEPTAKSVKIGDILSYELILQPGDLVKVTGISKGKGFAGGVKRWHFHGGPRTHGQSDRERAPGSIGSTTTPGRVLRGKKMAGRMGSDRITVSNLSILAVSPAEKTILIKGLVPGARQGLLIIDKIGQAKNFVPLTKTEQPVQSNQSEKEGQDEQN